jgi:hypothetical protein
MRKLIYYYNRAQDEWRWYYYAKRKRKRIVERRNLLQMALQYVSAGYPIGADRIKTPAKQELSLPESRNWNSNVIIKIAGTKGCSLLPVRNIRQ